MKSVSMLTGTVLQCLKVERFRWGEGGHCSKRAESKLPFEFTMPVDDTNPIDNIGPSQLAGQDCFNALWGSWVDEVGRSRLSH